MKITFTAEKQREIFAKIDIDKNESSMYETIMFKAVEDYIENTMEKSKELELYCKQLAMLISMMLLILHSRVAKRRWSKRTTLL